MQYVASQFLMWKESLWWTVVKAFAPESLRALQEDAMEEFK